MPTYKTKLILSGNHLQIYEYQTDIETMSDNKPIRDNYKKSKEGLRRNDSLYRTRNNLVRLIEANKTPYTKMITLTVADPDTSYSDFNKYLKTFYLQFKRVIGEPLKAVIVIEGQIKRQQRYNLKQAPPHAHIVVFNDLFISPDTLKRLWKHGNHDIHKLKKVKNVGRYIAKYITKQTLLLNKKGYRTTHNLKRPTTAPTVAKLPDDLSVNYSDTFTLYYGDIQSDKYDNRVNFSKFNQCYFREIHDITKQPDIVNPETGEIISFPDYINKLIANGGTVNDYGSVVSPHSVKERKKISELKELKAFHARMRKHQAELLDKKSQYHAKYGGIVRP